MCEKKGESKIFVSPVSFKAFYKQIWGGEIYKIFIEKCTSEMGNFFSIRNLRKPSPLSEANHLNAFDISQCVHELIVLKAYK